MGFRRTHLNNIQRRLRKILEQSHPYFVENPDRLQLFIDHGQIISTGAQSLSFEYRYQLNIIITDYADDLAKLIVPILHYLRQNQPELFENPAKRENAFKMELDFNDHHSVDVALTIELTERVIAKADKTGNINMTYAQEPQWHTESVRLYFNGELVLDSEKTPKD